MAEPGTTVGRYRVLSMAGEGGMGVVLQAHDPLLDRRVALKQLRVYSVDHERRLRREAEALARVHHANVVEVFDVLDGPGGLVVAMEYVEGKNLRQWLRAAAPPVARILEVFVDAGRGLAAVHAAGLVHRDFKPSNVLLGNDGRVRVMDFGLARTGLDRSLSRSQEEDEDALPSHEGPPGRTDEPLTEEGVVMGTPAYMAPEQHEGLPTDPRCDQFSFCVSLWEALCGRRPYRSPDLQELFESKYRGPPAWPAKPRLPLALIDAIRRGLEPEADDRWPTMDALLTAMRAPLRRRRGRRWAMGAVALGVAITGTAAATWDEPGPRCDDGRTRLRGVWDPARATEVEASLTAVGLPYAADTSRLVRDRLDAWSDAWSQTHQQACEAMQQSEAQQQARLDQRMRCLDRQRNQLDGVVQVLAQADARVAEYAVRMVDELPSPASCRDAEAEVELPRDPAQRQKVEDLRAALARLRPLSLTARHEDVAQRLEALVEPIESLGYEPLIAELRLRQAEQLRAQADDDKAAEVLEQAYTRALAVRHDALAFEAAIELGQVVGQRLRRHEDGERWIATAEALASAEDLGALDRALTYKVRGAVRFSSGRLDEAAADLLQALDLYRQHGAMLPQAHCLNRLAAVRVTQGDAEAAEGHGQHAIEILEQQVGPRHPSLAYPYLTLANIAIHRGDYAVAAERLTLARDLQIEAYGEDHPDLAAIENNLGTLSRELSRPDEAESHYQRALALREKVQGPDSPGVADVVHNLGAVAQDLGRFDEASRYYTRALRIWESAQGEEHPDVVLALTNLGTVEHRRGRLEEAEATLRRALALAERVHGPDHLTVAEAAAMLGSLLLDRGQPEAAEPLQRRALTLRTAQLGEKHPDVALSMSNLGWVLAERGEVAAGVEQHRTSVEILAGIADGRHPSLPTVQVRLGRLLLRSGAATEAVVPLRAAADAMAEGTHPPRALAEARLALAEALWPDPSTRASAPSHARAALKALRSVEGPPDGPDAQLRDRAQRWLDDHP